MLAVAQGGQVPSSQMPTSATLEAQGLLGPGGQQLGKEGVAAQHEAQRVMQGGGQPLEGGAGQEVLAGEAWWLVRLRELNERDIAEGEAALLESALKLWFENSQLDDALKRARKQLASVQGGLETANSVAVAAEEVTRRSFRLFKLLLLVLVLLVGAAIVHKMKSRHDAAQSAGYGDEVDSASAA